MTYPQMSVETLFAEKKSVRPSAPAPFFIEPPFGAPDRLVHEGGAAREADTAGLRIASEKLAVREAGDADDFIGFDHWIQLRLKTDLPST